MKEVSTKAGEVQLLMRENLMSYQYKTVKIQTTGLRGGEIDTEELDDLLNSFSSQGWEFANAFDTTTANGASKYVVVILRRSI